MTDTQIDRASHFMQWAEEMLGAGGRLKTARDCPLHGVDPDAEYERMRDDR